MSKTPPLSKAFSAEARERLSKKLVESVQFVNKLNLDKKASADGFKAELKSANKRVTVLAEVLEKQDMTLLQGTFYDDEISTFVSGRLN